MFRTFRVQQKTNGFIHSQLFQNQRKSKLITVQSSSNQCASYIRLVLELPPRNRDVSSYFEITSTGPSCSTELVHVCREILVFFIILTFSAAATSVIYRDDVRTVRFAMFSLKGVVHDGQSV